MDISSDRGADVVSLRGFRKAMAYDPIAEVEAYWEGLRGVRTVPRRSEIDPRGIERALSSTFLLERIAPGLARFRLAGMQLTSLMGMEVRGMPLTSILTTSAREEGREAMVDLFEGPHVVSFGLRGERSFGRPAVFAQMKLFPLKSDLGDISRALGCIRVDGEIGRTPRRFDIASKSLRQIGPFRSVQPPAPSEPERRERAPGMAEDAPAFRRKADARAHLRLIVDRDEDPNQSD